jgi:hypothetical protein
MSSLGSPLFYNNSLIIFYLANYVMSHAGDTLVSSDWSHGLSVAREYRYRHVFFYGSKKFRIRHTYCDPQQTTDEFAKRLALARDFILYFTIP